MCFSDEVACVATVAWWWLSWGIWKLGVKACLRVAEGLESPVPVIQSCCLVDGIVDRFCVYFRGKKVAQWVEVTREGNGD